MAAVCLDPDIEVADRFFCFVLKMLAQWDVAIPADGMGASSNSWQRRFRTTALCPTPVPSLLMGQQSALRGGEKIHGKAVVLATAGPETARLNGRKLLQKSSREVCFYYSTDQLPFDTGFLTLNGTGSGLINSVKFPSMIASGRCLWGDAWKKLLTTL